MQFLVAALAVCATKNCEGEIIDRTTWKIDLEKAKGCDYVLLDSLGLKDVGMMAVAGALEDMTDMRVLSLHGNAIGDEGAAALANIIARDRSTITELYLDVNKMTDIGFAALGEALKTNSRLKTLDLDHNPITDAGIAALMGDMHLNNVLESLDLVALRISDEGARAVGKYLARNSGGLTVIDMSTNDIGDEGARALAVGLQKNRILCELVLTGNEIGDFSAEAQMGEYIDRNRALHGPAAGSGAPHSNKKSSPRGELR
jgi:Ran GTPase-activating protein (RanGAP) involved in mRNA processing and transport